MKIVQAINKLEMTVKESRIFTVDFSSWVHPLEKVIGVSSVTLTPTGTAPEISQIGYSTDGKAVSFRVDARGAAVEPSTYALSVITTTRKSLPNHTTGIDQVIEARGVLVVNR